jgi:AcrR family transcriptional regulator
MPKLRGHQVERNQEKIEAAALRLFIQRGFHGTSVREIADAAGVSLGNIYNYYRTKEQLFNSLIRRYEAKMAGLMRAELANVTGTIDDPDNLRRLAAGVRRIVYKEPDYWRLMYMDITEFGNKHFAFVFRDLARRLQMLLGQPLQLQNGKSERVRPTVAFTAIYLQFFTYFLVEKLFGGKNHLGVPEEEAIEQLIEVFTHGVQAGSSENSAREIFNGEGTPLRAKAAKARG